VALAWLLRQEDVIAIPNASHAAHGRENRVALDRTLTDEELTALDRAFPPPRKQIPLDMR
jgi:diketogulonate reductase-like aldo/keto reductase